MRPPVVQYRLAPGAKAPTQGYPGDAGWDLYVLGGVVPPGKSADIPTGLFVAFPQGYYGRIVPRSSTLGRYGVVVDEGVIDDYRDDLSVQVINPTSQTIVVPSGVRIAQLLIHKKHDVVWEKVNVLPPSERGTRGFGSTGK